MAEEEDRCVHQVKAKKCTDRRANAPSRADQQRGQDIKQATKQARARLTFDSTLRRETLGQPLLQIIVPTRFRSSMR
jgi:hypothetical protein